MPMFLGTHPHLERGEVVLSAVIGEIEVGKQYTDGESNLVLHKGFIGVLATSWMFAGIIRHLERKLGGEAQLMTSYNEQDFKDFHKHDGEVVPD